MLFAGLGARLGGDTLFKGGAEKVGSRVAPSDIDDLDFGLAARVIISFCVGQINPLGQFYAWVFRSSRGVLLL